MLHASDVWWLNRADAFQVKIEKKDCLLFLTITPSIRNIINLQGMQQGLRFFFLLILLVFSRSASATHLMGGEITWECQGNGNYIFTLKLYRDCNGVPLQMPVGLRVHNHPSLVGIPMNLVSQTDISPQCNGSGPTISCAGGGNGAVEEFVFRSNSINMGGTPPPQGWVFTYDGCCRNAAISNLIISPNATGFTLRAIMYPYNGTNTSPCFDSSPVFAQRPATIICAGNPFTYNHNAYDPDKDSLVYAFAEPLDWLDGAAFTSTTPAAIPFQTAYNVNSPFPGPAQNSSIPAVINNQTGEISFTPNYTGNFVTVVKVSSYRCGQLIAEIFRELQVVILACGTNTAPTITAPFNDPGTGLQTSFTTTVTAGDPVSFTITATDNEFLPIGIAQTIHVSASGGQFGTNFTDPNSGCTDPPCATLSPAPPVILANNQTITFNWQTSCDHVAILNDCYVPSNTHTFVITFQDDYCPAPAYHVATVSVVVLAPPDLPPPSLRCADVLANGDVALSWVPILDPDGWFHSYMIYSSTSANGPFTLVDSVLNLNQNTYTDLGAGANTQSIYYQIRTRLGCGGMVLSEPCQTIQTIYLAVSDIGSGQIQLNWNPLSTPALASTQLPYRINKQILPAALSFLSTTNSVFALDSMQGCTQNINYQVQIADASGCISHSNIDGGAFSNDEAPVVPFFDSISVQSSGTNIILGWEASTSIDTRAYVIYQVNQAGAILQVDTVYGIASTQFISSGPNPSSGPISYQIAAIDICNNLSTLSPIHSSIFLEVEVSSCLAQAALSWTAYQGWSANPDAYQIFQKLNGGGWTLIASVNGNSNQFTVENLIPQANYCFEIHAVFAGIPASSTSNSICFNADVQDLPQFAYVKRATVMPSGSVYSQCYIDTASDIASYTVLRSLYPGNSFEVVHSGGVLPQTNYIDYNDFDVTTPLQSYTYRYELMDKCNNVAAQSNIGRSLLLQGVALDGFVNKLKWNAYEDWDAGVRDYSIYRSLDGGLNYSLLANSGLDSLYFDVVTDEVDTLLEFCYYVQAIEDNGNQYNFRDTSWSNPVCVVQKPTIYIPSAFRPGNVYTNNTFKALGLYEKLALEHEFMIYNRWGEQLFYTKDPMKAWDGKYLSAVVPTGIYVYRIRFKLADGSSYDKRGAVMLLD